MGRKSKRQQQQPPPQGPPANENAIPWEQVRSAPAGATRVVADAAGAVYLDTEAGVHASTDGGASWTRVAGPGSTALVSPGGEVCISAAAPPPPPDLRGTQRVTAAAIDASGALWVGVEAAGLSFYPTPGQGGMPILHGASIFTRRILRSEDRGATWRAASETLGARGFAFDARGRAWVASDAGLHVSEDGGASWRRALEGDARCVAVSGARVVAGTSSRAHVSDDEGRSFRPAASRFAERGPWGSIEGEASDFRALAVAPGGVIWAAANGFGGVVFRLAEGGDRWDSVNFGLTLIPRVGSRQGVRATSLALAPSGRAFVVTEGHGLFRRSGPAPARESLRSP